MNSSTTEGQPATGGIGLILLAILLVSFLLLLTRERPQTEAARSAESQEAVSSAETGTSGNQGPATSTNSPVQTVHGQKVSYSLSLPPAWKTQSVAVSGVDNLSATFGAVSIAVMVQEAKVGSSQDAATAAMTLLKESASEVRSTRPERFVLDGRPWLKFVVRCRVDQAQMGYQYYVYSGAEGTYQIVAWTELASFERELPHLRSIMNSFRFPPPSASSAGLDDRADSTTVLTRSAAP